MKNSVISEEVKRDIARDYEDNKIKIFVKDILSISNAFNCGLTEDRIIDLLENGDESQYLIDFQSFPRVFRFTLENSLDIHRYDLIDYIVTNYLLGIGRQRFIRTDDENIMIEGQF